MFYACAHNVQQRRAFSTSLKIAEYTLEWAIFMRGGAPPRMANYSEIAGILHNCATYFIRNGVPQAHNTLLAMGTREGTAARETRRHNPCS